VASDKPRALRLLHTSDWHLGIELATESRRADHELAIDSVVELAKDYQPDAIVHTGDLFDHARPGADDQALAVDALRRLSAIAPIVVVGGNHDNNVMLDNAWDPLAGGDRLRFRGRLRRPEAGGVVVIPVADNRRILICAVPFVTQHSFARFDRPGETTAGFTNGIKRIHDTFNEWLEHNADPASDKVIWAAHLLVDGARPAGSERKVDLADDYATSTSAIPPVSYAAFGHIHRAQELPGTITGRYAGGLLPFRFDEAREGAEAKTVVLVELPATGAAKMTLAPLSTGRSLIEVTARLEDLPARAKELEGAFVRVTVPLDGPVPGLSLQVAEALPGAIVIQTIPELKGAGKAKAKKIAESSDLGEMLERWLTENHVTGSNADRTAEAVRTMVESAMFRRRNALEGESLLDVDIALDLADELVRTMDWVDLEAEAAGADLVEALVDVADASSNGEEDQ
jgi:DNA repair protein SbcD/Mre11